jgi:hypothetical protein
MTITPKGFQHIVSHEHINAILTGYYAHLLPKPKSRTLTSIGQTLLFGNTCGFAAASGQDPPDEDNPPEHVSSYRYHKCELQSLGALLKFCDFLERNSCEAEDWPHSGACIELNHIRSTFLYALPEYKAAPWYYEKEGACSHSSTSCE